MSCCSRRCCSKSFRFGPECLPNKSCPNFLGGSSATGGHIVSGGPSPLLGILPISWESFPNSEDTSPILGTLPQFWGYVPMSQYIPAALQQCKDTSPSSVVKQKKRSICKRRRKHEIISCLPFSLPILTPISYFIAFHRQEPTFEGFILLIYVICRL